MFPVYVVLAERAYPHRWQIAVLAVAGMVLVIPLGAVLGALWGPLLVGIMVLAGPLVAILWGVVLACVWFHPTHGYLAAQSFVGRLPPVVSMPVRAFFAVFLAFWFVGGVLAWPVLALRGAWG